MWGQVYHNIACLSIPRIIPTRVGTRRSVIARLRSEQDHPHACGDKNYYVPISQMLIISSPRVWGQEAKIISRNENVGIIPTRVGTSNANKGAKAVGAGSSPRVWGQAKQEELRKAQARIIPTRVGTSDMLVASSRSCRDHPHACGDKKSTKRLRNGKEGSSPRVWGQVFFFFCPVSCAGIIPTRVGTRF